MRLISSLGFLFVSFAAIAEEAKTPATTESPELVAGNTSAAAQAAPGWTNFLFIAGIILFMWLFVFRPQSKRAKEQRDFLAALKPDMEVYTSGGIIGSITEVKDNIVVLNIGTSNIKVLKSSIAGKLDQSPSKV